MKRLFSLAALAVLMCAPSVAHANGPWSGCYIGAHLGMSASSTTAGFDAFGTADVIKIDGLSAAGVSGGATGGCDLQLSGTPIVLGLWGDWTQHSADFSITSSLLPVDVASMSLEHQWALGGKVGYALSDSSLAYVVGGYTQASFSDISVLGGAASLAVPDMGGYIVGGGLETKLGRGFSLDLRYTFTRLDKHDLDLCGGCGLMALTLQPDIHTARVGVTYRFGMAGIEPVSLK